MTERLQAPLKAGGVPTVLPGFGPVDPFAIRAKLMLEVTSHMMTEANWPYRRVTVEMDSQGDEIGAFKLFGANNPDSIRAVFERKIDISILNPAVILSMAHRGIGLFSEPMQVALIAVMPHYDQLAFAVSEASGLTSLDDIREKRFPLKLSVRGSQDFCTTRLVEKVLNVHGFGYDDIVSWGGQVFYDQPMPPQTPPGGKSRIERVRTGELDAIFEEGVMIWTNAGAAAGLRFLDIAEPRLVELEKEGFKRGKLEKSRYDRLPADVNVVDFSGWPVYCRVDTPDLLVRKFCEAMEARRAALPWNLGPAAQEPLPTDKLVLDTPATPIDLPFHPEAQRFWHERGYLSR